MIFTQKEPVKTWKNLNNLNFEQIFSPLEASKPDCFVLLAGRDIKSQDTSQDILFILLSTSKQEKDWGIFFTTFKKSV